MSRQLRDRRRNRTLAIVLLLIFQQIRWRHSDALHDKTRAMQRDAERRFSGHNLKSRCRRLASGHDCLPLVIFASSPFAFCSHVSDARRRASFFCRRAKRRRRRRMIQLPPALECAIERAIELPTRGGERQRHESKSFARSIARSSPSLASRTKSAHLPPAHLEATTTRARAIAANKQEAASGG